MQIDEEVVIILRELSEIWKRCSQRLRKQLKQIQCEIYITLFIGKSSFCYFFFKYFSLIWTTKFSKTERTVSMQF